MAAAAPSPSSPPSPPVNHAHASGFLKVLVGALAIAGLLVAGWVFPVVEWLNAFTIWVAGQGWLGIAIFIAAYVAATVLMMPGSPLTLGAGFAFGLVNGFFAAMAGSVLGAAAAFLVARHFARDAVSRRFGANEKFAAVDRAVGREGARIVFLLRLSPAFPFNVLNYVLGLTSVGFWRYVLASWIGMLPGTLLYVYIGYLPRSGLDAAAEGGAGDTLRFVYIGLGLLATVAVTIHVTRLAQRALRRHGENIAPDANPTN